MRPMAARSHALTSARQADRQLIQIVNPAISTMSKFKPTTVIVFVAVGIVTNQLLHSPRLETYALIRASGTFGFVMKLDQALCGRFGVRKIRHDNVQS